MLGEATAWPRVKRDAEIPVSREHQIASIDGNALGGEVARPRLASSRNLRPSVRIYRETRREILGKKSWNLESGNGGRQRTPRNSSCYHGDDSLPLIVSHRFFVTPSPGFRPALPFRLPRNDPGARKSRSFSPNIPERYHREVGEGGEKENCRFPLTALIVKSACFFGATTWQRGMETGSNSCVSPTIRQAKV